MDHQNSLKASNLHFWINNWILNHVGDAIRTCGIVSGVFDPVEAYDNYQERLVATDIGKGKARTVHSPLAGRIKVLASGRPWPPPAA